MTVWGCECRIWYRDQPPQCFVCREFSHRAQSCSLSGLCRRCRQPGHKARECTQAWDPDSDVDPLPDRFPSDSTVDPAHAEVPDPPVPADASVSDPVPPVLSVASASVAAASARVLPVNVDGSDDSVSAEKAVVSDPVSDLSLDDPVVDAYVSGLHASKVLTAEFPEFDGATDSEKDSKARAYVKRCKFHVSQHKEINLRAVDFNRWSSSDIRRFVDELCFKYCIPNNKFKFVPVQYLEFNQAQNLRRPQEKKR